MLLNLYRVSYCYSEWCVFVFDTSRGRAKARTAREFDGEYIHMRCQSLMRGVNVPFPMIVSSPDDEGYEHVLKCGHQYASDEELEELGLI